MGVNRTHSLWNFGMGKILQTCQYFLWFLRIDQCCQSFKNQCRKYTITFLFIFFLLGPGRRSRSFCGENVATFNLRGGGQESWNHEIRKRCADDREFKFCFCRIARFYQLLQMVKKYTKIIIFKRYCHTLYWIEI